jgi:hypothetical protein
MTHLLVSPLAPMQGLVAPADFTPVPVCLGMLRDVWDDVRREWLLRGNEFSEASDA